MADVKWIKIVTDIFDDEKMLLIDGLPEHDAIIVIWFKLLCLAGKQNNGGVFILNDKIPYNDEMLASIFHRPLKIVRLALAALQTYGMIEVVDDTITIPNWSKHQNLNVYDAKRARDREYQRRRRAEQRRLIAEKSSDNRLTTDDSSPDVAPVEVEVEVEVETDIDIYTTTTTARAYAHEVDSEYIPSEVMVAAYFRDVCGIDKPNGNPAIEAKKFVAYNASRGWDCLPDWQAAANLWSVRMAEHEKGVH